MSNAPTPNFGTAWSCITDITTPAIMVSGFRVVAEAVARRWITPRGQLLSDPNYGFDLTERINDDLDASGLSALGQSAAAEAKKDQRVLNCSCTITLTNGVMIVSALLSTAAGPFSLVLSISSVTTQILQVSP